MSNDKKQENPQTNDSNALTLEQKAEKLFGEEGVKCFEQMFTTLRLSAIWTK